MSPGAPDSDGAVNYLQRKPSSRSLYETAGAMRAPFGFHLRRHGPKVPSEGLARSTPQLRGVQGEFPSSKASEHPSVAGSGRAAPGVEIRTLSNRPRPSFERHPAKDGAFPKARMFGSASRSMMAEGIAPRRITPL